MDTSDQDSDDLLQVTTHPNRSRQKSASQQIPSDEDSDIDYDNVYTTGKLPKNRTSQKSSKIKKQKSQYAPLEKHKKQRKTFIYIIAIVSCLVIIALAIFFSIHSTKLNNSKANTVPHKVHRTTTKSPTYIPTISPTNFPISLPTITPSLAPTKYPTLFPSPNPSKNPSTNPTNIPSQNPSVAPTKSPSNNPTVTPTQTPSINPSQYPSQYPSTSPSYKPSNFPSQTPSIHPSVSTKTPTISPTPSPISMILQRGNAIYDQGITMNFPRNAFPDSILTINIGQATATTTQIFDDTTTGFKAMNIHNITGNAIHFMVEHNPLQIVANITYKTTIPIPTDLLRKCPDDYGYEIFTQIQQNEFPRRTFPIFVLFESLYNPIAHSLTTWLYPEMFHNKNADIIISCTPGINIVPVRRLRRTLLQNPNWETVCKAAEIICPIEGESCVTLNPFSRHHYGVDYVSTPNTNIISAANGVVERSDFSTIYGNVIIIRNEDGSATIYANLREKLVFLGAQVRQGQVIGIGESPCFHFEYIANGEIYQTKKRINPNDCFPPPHGHVQTVIPTVEKPSQSPLVPPNTHSPTVSPSTHLALGSITVGDSGNLADDSFAVYIDGFKVCETETGQPNTCAISFLRPGLHTLTLEVLIAPDTFGTFYVALINGWKFTDGTDSTTWEDYPDDLFPSGAKRSWDFTVPFPESSALNGNVPP